MTKPLRVYVSASSAEVNRAKRMIAHLPLAGIHVTHDWTASVEASPGGDASLSDEQRRSVADADLAGIDAADVVIWLVASIPSWGAPFEAGYAVSKGKPVVAVGVNLACTAFASKCIGLTFGDARSIDALTVGGGILLRSIVDAHEAQTRAESLAQEVMRLRRELGRTSHVTTSMTASDFEAAKRAVAEAVKEAGHA